MSRVTRISLAVLLSLVVVIAIYTTVAGASLSAAPDRTGSHEVSGAMVNLDHYRSAEPYKAPMPVPQTGNGHGCDSEYRVSPDD